MRKRPIYNRTTEGTQRHEIKITKHTKISRNSNGILKLFYYYNFRN